MIILFNVLIEEALDRKQGGERAGCEFQKVSICF